MAYLHIYDADDWRIRWTAGDRKVSGGRQMVAIEKNGQNLCNELDSLAALRRIYDRILIETHGSPGCFYFGNAYYNADIVRATMAGRNYDRFCATGARIYLNGCNIGEGQQGIDLLTAMGEVFLKSGGGTVFAHTSYGLGSIFDGHVVHFTGVLLTLTFDFRGKVTEYSIK